MKRVLYILPGPVPPNKNKSLEKMFFVNGDLAGDVLLPVWWRTPKDAESKLGPGSFPVYQVGSFNFHLFLLFRWAPALQPLARLLFTISAGRRIFKSGARYQVIMTYGNTLTAFCGLILKWLTGAKLIVEIPGVPHQAYLFEAPTVSASNRLKKFLSDVCLHIVVKGCDRVKLLYPGQLDPYPSLRNTPASVFHDFVPVNSINVQSIDERFVLLLGTPWYRKGVDVIIEAFKQIAAKVPGYKLKIVGYFPDESYLRGLIGDCSAIEILKPVNYEAALDLISRCTVLALPSRSEAMGRVLLEGMAARKPLVGAKVDGIPHYIKDGETGLLFTSENRVELAERLERLLADPAYAAQLGQNGYDYVQAELSEQAYARHFKKMIDDTTAG